MNKETQTSDKGGAMKNKPPKKTLSNIACIKCGATMRAKISGFEGRRKGEAFTVQTEGIVCSKCGYKTVDQPQLSGYLIKLSDAYREKHGLLTSTQLKAARERLKMTQEEFAEFVGVGSASLKRWESSAIQDKSSDRLIRLQIDTARARENYLNALISRGGDIDEFSGWQHFDFDKFAHLIVFFLRRLKPGPKTRKTSPARILNRLCWLSDAWHVVKHARSITGMRYAAINREPIPESCSLLFEKLAERDILRFDNKGALAACAEFRKDAFSEEELATLFAVWERYQKKPAAFGELAREEAAWSRTPFSKAISFKLVQKEGLHAVGHSRK